MGRPRILRPQLRRDSLGGCRSVKRLALVLLAVITTAQARPFAQTAEGQTLASVVGSVTDTGSRKPIAGVRLVAYGTTVQFVDSFATLDSVVAVSDSLGRFTLTSLRPGRYVVWSRPPFGWCGPGWLEFVTPEAYRDTLQVALHSVTCEGGYCHC